MRGGAALVPYPLMINPAGMHRPRPIGIAARTQGGPASPGSLSSIPEGTSRSRPGLGLSSSFAPAPAATSTPAAVGSHILVVDDAVSNRKLLMRIFRLKGFICEEACDGQQALDVYANMCAKHTPPGVILMDYEMPVLDGPSATKQLREKGCSCFIIGVTGNVMQDDKNFFISCGADDVFTKPLNTDSVLRLLELISSPRSSWGATSSHGGQSDLKRGREREAERTPVSRSSRAPFDGVERTAVQWD